ncbi:MAG: hypothetical protein RLZ88_853 [Actinomycetota bacterium]
MPKLLGFDNNDRFNLTMALIAWLSRQDGSPTVAEAAEHFGATEKDILKSVTDINQVTPDVLDMEYGMAIVDLDDLDDGVLTLLEARHLSDVPRLSNRQGSALMTGLTYLATLPEFDNDADLQQLLKLLGGGLESGQNLVELVQQPVDPDVAVLREALMAGKRIRCEYINQTGELRTRELDPLRIDPRPDHWYLRAWCVDSQMVKNFRLDRMKNAVLTATDIAEEARKALTDEDALYIANETDTEVLVEVDPEAYRLIAESNDVSAIVAKEGNQGTVRATIRVGYLPNIGHLIARYGGAARVIAPQEAVEHAAAFARNALGESSDGNKNVE